MILRGIKMKFTVLAAAAIITAGLTSFTGQAQAMNLMMALTNDSIQIVASNEGTLTIIEEITSEPSKIASADLNKTEPAAGE